jgi:hypothetical protein
MCCYPWCLDGTPSKRDGVHGGTAYTGRGSGARRVKTSHAYERYLPDLEAYYRRARGGRCFVCAIVA